MPSVSGTRPRRPITRVEISNKTSAMPSGGEDECGEPDHLARGDPPGPFGWRRGDHGHSDHRVVEVGAGERARGKSENRREAG